MYHDASDKENRLPNPNLYDQRLGWRIRDCAEMQISLSSANLVAGAPGGGGAGIKKSDESGKAAAVVDGRKHDVHEAARRETLAIPQKSK